MGRSRRDRRSLREVRESLGYPREGPREVGVPSGRSGSGRGTLGEVREWSGDPQGGTGGVGGVSGRSQRERGNLGEGREGSRRFYEVWEGKGDPRGGP